MKFLLEKKFGPGPWSLVIDDDGEVCYAYLCRGREIVGDVWLYNRAPTPLELPWEVGDAKDGMPFLNPAPYVREPDFALPAGEDDFRVESEIDEAGSPVSVSIFVKGKLLARLGPGDLPGYSRLARTDGPLALALHAPGTIGKNASGT
jgi:hypothetical protein